MAESPVQFECKVNQVIELGTEGGAGNLIICEVLRIHISEKVLNADGTPHESNGRATIEDDDNDFWFGFEQEYFLWNLEINKPLGFPANGYPAPQGPYYCSVGAKNAYGRDIIEEHLEYCLQAGLNVEGINAEVAAGQWEFQIFSKGAKDAGDQIWVARYLLERMGEKYGVGMGSVRKILTYSSFVFFTIWKIRSESRSR